MAHPDERMTPLAVRRVLLGFLLGSLALLCGVVLRPFAVPMIWAAILAYSSWPVFRLVSRRCRHRQTLSALAMTTLVALALIGPLFWLAALAQGEVADAYQALLSYASIDEHNLPPFLRSLPLLGDAMQQTINRYAADPQILRQVLIDWALRAHTELLGVAGDVGRTVAKFFIAIITVFFLYRDGERLARQAATVLARFFGDRLDRYLRTAGVMTRAVIFGLLVTALIQGTVAGIGYAVFGVEAPVLLGALTALASIVPVVGTLLVWGSVSVVLGVTGHLWLALGLLSWGTLLVHPADNVIRPLFISKVTRLPFLLVMFGVLGGLAAFGLVGLFIGPVALAIATAVWREWVEDAGDGGLPSSSDRGARP